MNSIKKNIIYNFSYQLLSIILPLITLPYVSKILLTTGVGIYSFTYSIVYYFMLIALLGINTYGNRTISKNRDNLSKTFLSIYYLQLLMSLLMIILYIVYLLIFCNNYIFISWIQIIYLISTMLDISWFFYGLEDFRIMVIRNSIVKILALVLILVFVKTKNDVWIYTLILSSSTLLSQLIMWPFLIKKIKFTKINFKDILKHFKPCLILFMPVIAVSLYRVMDKIMLGYLTSVDEVGIYEQADKIILVPITFINAFGAVMLPRMSNLISKKNDKLIYEYIYRSIKIIMFLSFPICFGLIAVSNNFIPIFLGESFNKSATLISYLSITITFVSFANVIKTEYLIPKEKDKDYVICTILGALVNIILNILLIPKYASIGACIGTIGAEFIAMFYQVYAVKKELPIKKYIKSVIPFFIKSIIMFLIISLFNYLKMDNLLISFIKIMTGIIIYILLNLKFVKEILKGGKYESAS